MDRNSEAEMSLVGHLTELRTRIIICLAALILCVAGALVVSKPILDFLTDPINRIAKEPGRDEILRLIAQPDGTLRVNDPRLFENGVEALAQRRFEIVWPENRTANLTTSTLHFGEKASQTLIYTKPMDPIMLLLKVALIVGIFISLPILLWQTWLFVKPGLKKKEQSVVKPLMAGAVVLFPVGAAFAYFMITLVLRVMQAYAVENVVPMINASDYISMLFNMMLIFGFIFEVPLALAIASRIGLVTPDFLQRYRRHAYVFLAVAAMVISPGGDPFTMLIALVPLVTLYEISVALAIPMARLHKRDQELEEDEEEEEEDDWTDDGAETRSAEPPIEPYEDANGAITDPDYAIEPWNEGAYANGDAYAEGGSEATEDETAAERDEGIDFESTAGQLDDGRADEAPAGEKYGSEPELPAADEDSTAVQAEETAEEPHAPKNTD